MEDTLISRLDPQINPDDVVLFDQQDRDEIFSLVMSLQHRLTLKIEVN